MVFGFVVVVVVKFVIVKDGLIVMVFVFGFVDVFGVYVVLIEVGMEVDVIVGGGFFVM